MRGDASTSMKRLPITPPVFIHQMIFKFLFPSRKQFFSSTAGNSFLALTAIFNERFLYFLWFFYISPPAPSTDKTGSQHYHAQILKFNPAHLGFGKRFYYLQLCSCQPKASLHRKLKANKSCITRFWLTVGLLNTAVTSQRFLSEVANRWTVPFTDLNLIP